MVLSAHKALQAVESRHGPFGRATIKPYSRVLRALDGLSLLKVYVGIDPAGRRRREAEAIRLIGLQGLSVPAILGTGVGEDFAWTVFQALPGEPCTIATPAAIRDYLVRVLALTYRLHRPIAGLAPGSGWVPRRDDPPSQRGFLLGQMSFRCRLSPWWSNLAEALEAVDQHPVVRLHGDLKPEHLLVNADRLHVVDWEASGRGPAAADHADVAFHLIRDLIYEGIPTQRVPVGILGRLALSGPVMAWRLLLWLDRRRPQDTALMPPELLHRLAASDHPTKTWAVLAQAVSTLRARGVPR